MREANPSLIYRAGNLAGMALSFGDGELERVQRTTDNGPLTTGNRPSMIAVEMRLTIDEAEALRRFCDKCGSLVTSRVVSWREEMVEPLGSALGKLIGVIDQRQEPF